MGFKPISVLTQWFIIISKAEGVDVGVKQDLKMNVIRVV